MAAVADPHVRVSGDDVWIPEALPFLAGYWASGLVITAVRIESPTLRTLTPIDVMPFDLQLEPGSPPPSVFQTANPKLVGGTEALNVKATSAQGFSVYALMFLCDGPITPATGEIFTVKATATATCVANTWINGALTFAQSLPKGRYQIVGMRAKSDTLIAARLVIPGFAWRPGCIGCDAYTDLAKDEMRLGKMGVWGEFSHDVPPTVDFLATTTDSSEEVWLDLIKVG